MVTWVLVQLPLWPFFPSLYLILFPFLPSNTFSSPWQPQALHRTFLILLQSFTLSNQITVTALEGRTQHWASQAKLWLLWYFMLLQNPPDGLTIFHFALCQDCLPWTSATGSLAVWQCHDKTKYARLNPEPTFPMWLFVHILLHHLSPVFTYFGLTKLLVDVVQNLGSTFYQDLHTQLQDSFTHSVWVYGCAHMCTYSSPMALSSSKHYQEFLSGIIFCRYWSSLICSSAHF